MTTIIDEGVRAIPPGPRKCLCVVWHRPSPVELHRHHVLPTGAPWHGPDVAEALVWLCPNSHADTHRLLRLYLANNGKPSAEKVAPFGRYVRKLAARAWAQHTGTRMEGY
jgi:hypothetical protein